jgi:hypothetical protein
MPDEKPLTRAEFDSMAAQMGISGEPDYLDELFSQVRGLVAGADSLRQMDVSSAEPDMVFVPPGA